MGTTFALNTPYIQRKASALIARELSAYLDTKVTIGHINLGLFNRIIIDDLLLNDRTGKEMLKASRLSVKFNLISLFNGRISISNVQLFGFNASLERETPQSEPNFQFVVDAFAAKDTLQKEQNLNLRINSLVMSRGRVSYDVWSADSTPGRFNPSHLCFTNLVANISLKALQNDSINAAVKRLSVEEEKSGFTLKKLSLKMTGNNKRMNIEHFTVDLPHSSLAMDTISLRYDSLESFANPVNDVHFTFRLLPSEIMPSDLAPFIPLFTPFSGLIRIEAAAHGTVNQLEIPKLSITANNHFQLLGSAALQDLSHPEDAYIFGKLTNLYVDREGVDFFSRNLIQNYTGTPPMLQRLGTILFTGELSGYFTDLVTYGRVRTDLGSFQTDVKLSSRKAEALFSYSGRVKTEEFQLGGLLGDTHVGNVTFNLDVQGKHREQRYPDIVLKGLIAAINYNEYTYHNITLDGEYKQGGFDGQIALNDENGSVLLNGSLNAVSRMPTFNFRADVRNVRLHELHLTPKHEGSTLSLKMTANFTGGSIDEMDGEINIDSLHFTDPKKDYFLPGLKIAASRTDDTHKYLSVTSNFLQAHIEGDYSYRTLPAGISNIISRYIPTLIPPRPHIESENNFSFDLRLEDAEFFSAFFDVPLKVYTTSTLKGYFNDKAQRMHVEGYFPRLLYGNNFIESGMLLCQNPNDEFDARIRFNNRKPTGTVNLSIEAQAKDDSISTTLNWGNSSAITYSGKVAATTLFESPQKSITQIKRTNVILNDTLWEIHPSQIVVDSGKVHINNFYFSHAERYLRADGIVSALAEDTARLELKDINIGYVFDIARLNVNFKGEATGTAYASGVLQKPVMHTDLFIRNLGLNDGLLGDTYIHGEWHNEVEGIFLQADIREKEIARSQVEGYIYPLKPKSGLDLHIRADSTNLKFIEHYLADITPEFDGRATGDVHFYGKFNALELDGKVLADASMKVEVLNTSFRVRDSILVRPDGLTFANNRLFDTQGHEGRLSGYVNYTHFKNAAYNLRANVTNMLMMNTKESLDFPFYGVVYGTGSTQLSGNENDGLSVTVAITTERNTNFVYIKDNVSSAVNNQFIKFVDRTPRRQLLDSINLASDYELAQQHIQREADEENETDIHLNLLVEATPDATMRIIMDPIAGDYISGRGSGSIRTDFYNKTDDLKMFGNYHINQGIYKFSLQEVIRKDFTIKDGSTITFSGAPSDATLDIQAAYTVNSVSLNDLMPNASDYVNQTNIKVNCTMAISGQLTAPNIQLGLEVPGERDEVQALIRNYIPTDEQMNMQILYLLALGKFSTPENIETTQSSNMMASAVVSTLSGQLSNALSQALNLKGWNFGANLNTGTDWTDVEVEGLLSANLLNNRLLINGNFGYRDNPLANTNFVGDFDAEWLVTRGGDIRLKAYNETNDRYYTKTNLTTQGIGIIFKKDFSHWRELMFWNKWRLKQMKKQIEQKK
ncbi:MAG: translocation/assembly module TamB [Prevotellaceae bacterium]|nr:translocation/assembly module TamB [Prevotellaceae bacterium]